ncbi:hypothetical protein BJY01DRAFT_257771 [Aspergillus pseudoustus]|uniref:NmrA-like domain-containing protein n=1 Tax=Aspergillus pseudoustus TaxID=1810923 RepID=A0ABR4JHZ4_9EURO
MSKKLVAIAGGTGTIGSSILRALLMHPGYTPIVLSRATNKHPSGTSTITQGDNPVNDTSLILGAQVVYRFETRYVDYDNVSSLASALTGVDIVISALLIPGPELVSYQLNLLDAAIAAGVSRFAPSEFALCQDAHAQVSIDHGKIEVWDAVRRAVRNGQIDAAAFPCGMFMNYLAVDAGLSAEDRDRPFYEQPNALARFTEGPLMFHLSGPQPYVEVPLSSTGEIPELTMTDIRDVGKFVAAALDIKEPWGGRELGMVGETAHMADIVETIGKALGKKVELRGIHSKDLEHKLTRLDTSDIMGRIDTEYTMACGRGMSTVEPYLNQLCPDVHPTKIRGFLEEAWVKH